MKFGFRLRMMMAMLLVAGACVLSVAWISYSDSKSMIEQNYVQSLDETMTLQMNAFDDTMKEMYQTVQHICGTQELADCIDVYLAGEQTYEDGTAVTRELSELLTFNRWGSALYLYLPQLGKAFSSEEYYAVRDSEKGSVIPWEEENDNPFVPLYFTNRMARSSQRVFAYTQPVLSKNGEIMAFLCITVDERQLYYGLLDELNGSDGENYMILSEDGMICSGEDTALLGTRIQGLSGQQNGRMNADMAENGLLYTSVEAPFSHYRMLCQSDLSMLTKDIREHVIYLLLLVSLVFMVLIFIAKILSNQLYRPIQALTEAMDDVGGGDFTARVSGQDADEFGVVLAHFNEMVSRMDGLMDQVVQERTEKREAEINALQYQIRPHFMYNTLETIVWLAEEGRNSEVVEMTMAFTGFLRISLSRGADYITVEREEQHVANYLQIQSVRYGGIMRYTIDIDPALHERYMLKIVLQPLVENAIYHGIKRRRGRGQITVTGRRQAGGMYFAVEDNGMGMTPERLAEVRASLQNGAPLDPDGKGGYGLRNVEQRLRLYYGCGLTIESEYRHGTRISFTVPDEQEGKTL